MLQLEFNNCDLYIYIYNCLYLHELQERADLSSMTQFLSASRDFVVVMLHTAMKFLGLAA